MNDMVISSIVKHVQKEPFARKLGLRLIKAEPGYAMVEMEPQEELINIFGMTHGGAIFSLIDEAFEVSCNTHGTVAVALSVTVTYHRAPDQKSKLRAESMEIHRSAKTGTYEIKVTDEHNTLIASCTALCYRKKEKLPFLATPSPGTSSGI
jgi:acyl-CoA thioesterase